MRVQSMVDPSSIVLADDDEAALTDFARSLASVVAEGGTIEVSPQWHVNAGVDNLGGRGMLSVFESTNAADAAMLQAFGRDSNNLADRDRNLIFFASPTQLVIVEDHRWYGMDYYIN